MGVELASRVAVFGRMGWGLWGTLGRPSNSDNGKGFCIRTRCDKRDRSGREPQIEGPLPEIPMPDHADEDGECIGDIEADGRDTRSS